jgi:hypothetical protein
MTSNPERKYLKKLKYAKTPEQKAKAEQMLKVLTKKKSVKPKVRTLTDDEVLAEAVKYNKGCFAEKQKKERSDKKEMTRSLKAAQLREELHDRKIAEDEAEEKVLEEAQEEFIKVKMERNAFFKRLEDHGATLKVQYPDKLDELFNKILKDNNQNKKKAKKVYKRIIENQTHMIEMLIQEHMVGEEGEGQEMSYEVARKFIYSEMFRKV